ncbi:hypothetical protein MPS_2976 [Mycobacterium pseudoshottsii JCM 15466]|nr:hypothetical protein MMSP_2930 [Mycobacterium sp. 012931]EPQ77027.1 hypothetical protein MMMB2_1688 [Mycobacterium marinum MB2]GAQ36068.1 hypothetical protein MPS_2976 [Mycobacterium pseudoshottsii JCM 15466]
MFCCRHRTSAHLRLVMPISRHTVASAIHKPRGPSATPWVRADQATVTG